MLEYLYGKRFGFENSLSLLAQAITPVFSNLVILYTCLPVKVEQTENSKTSVYKIQTPGNYPEENIQHLLFMLYFASQSPVGHI